MTCLILMFSIVYAQDYQLVWSDEFDGTELDLSKWEYMTGDGTAFGLPSGWGNNELQWYRPENLAVTNGSLIITAKKENYSGKKYTSARIRTIHKGDWKYGRFEFRIKFPVGKGIWPAIWLYPTDSVYGGWAASGEVDIIEYLGHQSNMVYGTLHYGGQWPQNQSKGKSYTLPSDTFDRDFHVFAMEWEERAFKWYVDGKLYQTLTSWYSSNGNYPAPFDQCFHLIMNVAVGGNWPGNPDASTVFPQTMEVDYVRIYQEEEKNPVQEKTALQPAVSALEQNYPNPFNPTTTLKFTLAKPGHITLNIYNLKGQEIATVFSGFRTAGEQEIPWTAMGLPSGIYLARLQAEEFSQMKKMVLQR
jgi:beta-glucanase (GH16 family)